MSNIVFSMLIVKSFTIKQRFTTCSLASFINTRTVLSVYCLLYTSDAADE